VKSDFHLTRRFWWWAPWGTTRWWRFWIWQGGDEWGNVPVCIDIPLLGTFIYYWRRKWRTMPGAEEWAYMSADERADYAPCGYLYGGEIRPDGHHHWEDECDNFPGVRWE